MPVSLLSRAMSGNKTYLFLIVMAVLSLLLFSTPSFSAHAPSSSAPSDSEQRLIKQRELYTQALKAVKKKDVRQVERLLVELEGYPLHDYIQSSLVSLTLKDHSFEAIEQFVEQKKALPPVSRLQQRWLASLAAQKRWSEYLDAYQLSPVRGHHYRCLKLHAQIRLLDKGQKLPDALMRDISGMWQQGFSQPESCNPVFARWKKQGGMNSDIAQSRFWNAVEERDFKLARYAQSFIKDKSAIKDAEFFWKVRNNPERYLKKGVFNKDNSHHSIIVTYAVRRMAGKKLTEAARRWLLVRDDVTFSESRLKSLNEYFGIRLSANFVDDADELTARIDPDFVYPEVTQWRIRLALAAQNWPEVARRVERLPEELKSTSRWSYWLAVAHQHQTGQKQILEFAEIAKDRSYYGFLAADQAGLQYSMNYEKADIPAEVRNRLENHEAVLRMKELVVHEQMLYARQEWNRMYASMDTQEKHGLAYLADEWGWHSQAIYGAAKIKKWNDLDIRFPVKYFALYQKHTEKSGIPLNWALSITRKESAFNPEARSGVGARGLMQLMPKTAKSVARRLGRSYGNKQALYDPDLNIALGAEYLAQMKGRFGSRIFATAAYNAGPHRVKKWLAARGDLPLDVWIEVIPFKETRGYVQSVLEFGVVYDILSSRKPHFMLAEEQGQLALSLLEADSDKTVQ